MEWKVFKNKFWVSFILLLIIHQITQKILNVNLRWLDNYLDALLCMPILLGLLLQERQFIIAKYFKPTSQKNYQFSILEITLATIFFAIIFEEGFPKWSIYFTKDYWDYVAYFVGAFLFHFFINDR